MNKALLAIIAVLLPLTLVFGQQDRISKTRVIKEVQGEVVSVSKRNIAVLFGRSAASADENEILIPYNPKEVKVEHVRSVTQLVPGDIVRVLYEENTVKGQGKDKVSMRATVISFVKKGQPKPVTGGTLESGPTEAIQ